MKKEFIQFTGLKYLFLLLVVTLLITFKASATYYVACYYYDAKANYDNNNPSLMFQNPARKNFYWSIDKGYQNIITPTYTKLTGDIVDGIFNETSLTKDQLEAKCNKSISEGRPTSKSKPTYRLLEYTAATGATSPTQMGYEYPIFFTKNVNTNPMKKMVIFGDSLSDNDNLKRWLKVMPEYPYWFGRFTNGYTWSEYLSQKTNLTLFNWAVGGAKSDKTNDISAAQILKYVKAGGRNFVTGSMTTSIDRYINRWLTNNKTINPNAAKNTVYVLWIGANDYLEKFDNKTEFNLLLNDPTQPGGYENISTRAVENIIINIKKLASKGAINFLIPNLPNVGYIPTVATTTNFDFTQGPINNHQQLSKAITKMAQTHNQKLAIALQSLSQQMNGQINILPLDIYGDFEQLIAGKNPFSGGAFDPQFVNDYTDVYAGDSGLKIPKKCFSGGYLAISHGVTNAQWKKYASDNTCNNGKAFNYLSTYWDDVHPTSYSHCLLSYAFHFRMHEKGYLSAPPLNIEAHRDFCKTQAIK